MEDNISQSDPTFAPGIFSQASEMVSQYKVDIPNGVPAPTAIDLDTAKILVEIPFDIASQIFKMNDICLTEKQTDKLGKLWRAPLEKILSKYEDSDIIIAVAATVSIAGEKFLEYKLEQSRRNSPRNEGEGKDKLHQVEAA